MTTERKGLTSADREPPLGTVVQDACGGEWIRSLDVPGLSSYWLPWPNFLTGDPESWPKIAGNYGPVTIKSAPARTPSPEERP